MGVSYEMPGAWLIWPEDPEADLADVFYVHSTTYSESEHWNAPLMDREAEDTLRRIAAPNEVGPFFSAGAVYAPRYRQATLFAAFTRKFDGRAAHELAYQDVEDAFRAFVAATDPHKPMILAGYGQGGLHVLGLLQNVVSADADLKDRLAVAYVIGHAVPMTVFDDGLGQIPPCGSDMDTNCVVSYVDLEPRFDDEHRRFRRWTLAWDQNRNLVSVDDTPLLCINPLSWSATIEPVSAANHIGAASATGLQFGETPPAISQAIGAQCMDGVLIVDRPSQNFLRRRHWFGAHWRPQTFNLFYHDLAANARQRALELEPILLEKARILDPIADAVDVIDSPVNKVPD